MTKINTKSSSLIIPIETKVREFHAKLLLSCFAAEAGLRVILGDQNEILRYLDYLPRGIYVDKSVARTKIKKFKKNVRMGNRVVAWCEEGLIFLDPKAYLKERISVDAFNLVDLFFAWGDIQSETIKTKVGPENDKIICTGNPRFDLLREPYRRIFVPEADRIRSKHGPFILINTNFARYNHFYGRDFVIRTMKEQGRIRSDEDEAFFVGWSDYLGEMFRYFVDMVGHMSKSFPEYTIVVRPHPSESQETWKKKTGMFENVRIIHEGNVITWIIASEVMIHNGCTTGVEAYILDEPVVCYCPISSATYDSELPNAVSAKTSSVHDLERLIRSILKNPFGFAERRREDKGVKGLLGPYLSGFNGSTACSNIVSALQRIAEKGCAGKEPENEPCIPASARLITESAIRLKGIVKRVIKGNPGLEGYLKQKFVGLTLDEVKDVLSLLREISGAFKSVQVKPLAGSRSCFFLYRDSKGLE
jgi:surface carbohydrate biosynthesis protein